MCKGSSIIRLEIVWGAATWWTTESKQSWTPFCNSEDVFQEGYKGELFCKYGVLSAILISRSKVRWVATRRKRMCYQWLHQLWRISVYRCVVDIPFLYVASHWAMTYVSLTVQRQATKLSMMLTKIMFPIMPVATKAFVYVWKGLWFKKWFDPCCSHVHCINLATQSLVWKRTETIPPTRSQPAVCSAPRLAGLYSHQPRRFTPGTFVVQFATNRQVWIRHKIQVWFNPNWSPFISNVPIFV